MVIQITQVESQILSPERGRNIKTPAEPYSPVKIPEEGIILLLGQGYGIPVPR